MITWILVISVNFVKPYADVMLTSVPGFTSKEACEKAGLDARVMQGPHYLSANFNCVEQRPAQEFSFMK